MVESDFSYNVFINFPFDEKYLKLRNAMIFAVLDCGFLPKCALEEDDSGNVRFEKIKKLIEASRYGIHDISRIELSENGYPRFNMPLELGFFIGAKCFGNRRQKTKACLILDKEPHRYQAFISDIAGQDIKSHQQSEDKIVQCVRDWLNSQDKTKSLHGPKDIIKRLREFDVDLPVMCKKVPIGVDELTYNDYLRLMSEWLRYNTRGALS